MLLVDVDDDLLDRLQQLAGRRRPCEARRAGATRRARSPRGAWSRSGSPSCNSPRPATSKRILVGGFARSCSATLPSASLQQAVADHAARAPCRLRCRRAAVVDDERHRRPSAGRSAGPGAASSTAGSQKVSATVPFGQAGDGDDVAGLGHRRSAVRSRPRKARILETRPVSTSLPSRSSTLTVWFGLTRAGGDAAGDDAAEIGVGLEHGAEHAERPFLDRRRRHVRAARGRTAAPCPGRCGPSGRVGHPAVAARAVEDREIELLVGGVERGEQVEHLVEHFGRRARRAGRSC